MRKFFIRTPRNESDRGFLSAEWMIGIVMLLLPTFVIVYSMVQLPSRKNLTQVASAAAARAYVQALDQSQADAAARVAAAEAIASENGMKVEDIEDTVQIKRTEGKGYCPGAEFTVTVKLPLPVALDPFNGYKKIEAKDMVSSSATERIDDYAELADSDSTGATPGSYDVDPGGVCDE